jgi:hypothetical protein
MGVSGLKERGGASGEQYLNLGIEDDGTEAVPLNPDRSPEMANLLNWLSSVEVSPTSLFNFFHQHRQAGTRPGFLANKEGSGVISNLLDVNFVRVFLSWLATQSDEQSLISQLHELNSSNNHQSIQIRTFLREMANYQTHQLDLTPEERLVIRRFSDFFNGVSI